MLINIDSLIDSVVNKAEGQRKKARQWTPAEEAFLIDNLGKMTEAQMGKALGRTATAVRLRWKRDMQLPSPSKAPGILTGRDAARLLGIDEHKISHWVDKGLISGRVMAGGRKIRLIERADFEVWCLDHDNWIYFKTDQVKDPELKKKILAAAKKWRDEWWTAPQVARHHKVKTGDVKRYIKHGRIQARQITVSYGGRHPQLRWRLWFVLRSEATRPDLKFAVRRNRVK